MKTTPKKTAPGKSRAGVTRAEKSPPVSKKRRKSIQMTTAGPRLTGRAPKAPTPRHVSIEQSLRLKAARERWENRVSKAVDVLTDAFTEVRTERSSVGKELRELLKRLTDEAKQKEVEAM